jgi:predicted nucleic acid-binding protein
VIAVDTNLLVYAHRSSLPEHRRARRALEQASRDPRGWGIALASVAEF